MAKLLISRVDVGGGNAAVVIVVVAVIVVAVVVIFCGVGAVVIRKHVSNQKI